MKNKTFDEVNKLIEGRSDEIENLWEDILELSMSDEECVAWFKHILSEKVKEFQKIINFIES